MARRVSIHRAAIFWGMAMLVALSVPAYAQPSGGSGSVGGVDKPVGSGGGDKGGYSAPAGRGNPDVAASGAGASDFAVWLSSSREGQRLSSVRERLLAIATPAIEAGVPLQVFSARIREAVAKGVAPDIIVQALDVDAGRWIWLSGVLRGADWPPARSAPDLYLSAASALRNGLTQQTVSDVVTFARSSGAPSEKAGAALTTAAAIATVYRTGDSLPGILGNAAVLMIHSRLNVGQYAAVADMANRARAAGIDAGRFIAAMEASLGRGGTLADLERSLFG